MNGMRTTIGVLLATATLGFGEPGAGKAKLPPPPSGYTEPTKADLDGLLAKPADLQWHKDAKLGISIHWGPVALTGVPMSWGRHGARPGAGSTAKSGVPAEEYDQLYTKFNPVKFDASEWIKLFKQAGAKYFYFTSKHHDGFCMFDSKLTDYDIMSGPFKRDVVGELASAAHENDIKVFWYYSQPDWTHPNALQDGHYEKYLPYMKGQLKELLTNYGKIDGIWFDHLASQHYHWDTLNLVPGMRAMQPGLLVNKRVGNGLPEEYQGDFTVYELRVGPHEEPRQWESNITLGKAWAWHGGDLVKPFDTTLRLFLQVVANGGNLLLNLGPKPDGEIYEKDRLVLEQLGTWMDDYSAAIYGTTKGTYKPGLWGGSTVKGDQLFLYVLQQAQGDTLEFTLPALPVAPTSAKLLTPGSLETKLGKIGNQFTITGKPRLEPAVIQLSFDRDISGLEAVETYPRDKKLGVAKISASSDRGGKFSVDALMEQSNKGVFGEGIHIKNWWAPKESDKTPFLEIELEKPAAIDSLFINESIRAYAVRKFRVLFADSAGTWQETFAGTTIGEMLAVKLGTPETKRIRIEFQETEDGKPNITTVELFGE